MTTGTRSGGQWIRPGADGVPVVTFDPKPSERDREAAAREAARPARAGEPRPPRARLRQDWLPLLGVLLVQGVLSYRLVGTNTAFVDEGTYIYSGYQELAHILHGRPVAPYESFFSGAPVIYPVVVALADMAGGLTGTRLLSLFFMLSATLAVHLATRRLRGSTAAFFAAALFAGLGPTQFLGIYSTYDAMALACLAWAGYFAVRLATGGTYLCVLPAALAMALADATKYASLLWTPAVLGVAVFAGRTGSPWAWARWRRGLVLFAVWAVALVVPAVAAGGVYWHGFDSTTLQRKIGTDAPGYVARAAASWVGALLVLTLIALVVSWFASRRRGGVRAEFWLVLVLLGAGAAAPVNQIRIHTWLSLQKHVDFGAWFACIAVGVLLARVFVVLARRVHASLAVATSAALVGVLGCVGASQANDMFSAWPNSSPLIGTLKPYIQKGTDQYLVEDYDVVAYYFKDDSNWQQWSDLVGKTYQDPVTHQVLTGADAIKAAVAAHQYQVVVLDFAQTAAIDAAVQPALKKAGYRVLTTVVSTEGRTSAKYTIYLAPGFAE
ncbi:hypothetical protein ABH931_000431 [Streptacidiphilus sp. MAP12-33]|uniref:hypothetical protein n=1 Tax=Streptacidiphilus sp. MAP12-33 TaxID=3156266 RepID=UPI003513483F